MLEPGGTLSASAPVKVGTVTFPPSHRFFQRYRQGPCAGHCRRALMKGCGATAICSSTSPLAAAAPPCAAAALDPDGLAILHPEREFSHRSARHSA